MKAGLVLTRTVRFAYQTSRVQGSSPSEFVCSQAASAACIDYRTLTQIQEDIFNGLWWLIKG
jgi:hypothetical protein